MELDWTHMELGLNTVELEWAHMELRLNTVELDWAHMELGLNSHGTRLDSQRTRTQYS